MVEVIVNCSCCPNKGNHLKRKILNQAKPNDWLTKVLIESRSILDILFLLHHSKETQQTYTLHLSPSCKNGWSKNQFLARYIQN